MTTTFIARIPGTDLWFTRASKSMTYTHALIVGKGGEKRQLVGQSAGPYSWHQTEEAAKKAAQALAPRNPKDVVQVVEVEAREGGKAKVEKQLIAEAEKRGPSPEAVDEALTKLGEEMSSPAFAALVEVGEGAGANEKKPATTAGKRSIPTKAANRKRQSYLDEVGVDRYRQQYNAGWDLATAGKGAEKAASGEASIGWMDGYTDRQANPGKAGIAQKWAALRSTTGPISKVAAK